MEGEMFQRLKIERILNENSFGVEYSKIEKSDISLSLQH